MRGESLGKAPLLGRCAPSHTAQHGPGGGQAAIRIDDAAIPKHALIPKALLRRLCPLLLPLLAMSVDAKLDVFPGEKPQAGDVLDWIRLADLFTKVLDRVPFEKLRSGVMNLLEHGVTYLAPRGRRPRSAG